MVNTAATAVPAPAAAPAFKPVPLRDPGIAGYKFPEASDTILGWVEKKDQKAINTHAWGIWTSLTRPSGERFESQELLVFETWETPSDIMTPSAKKLHRNPRPVVRPHQLLRAGRKGITATSTHGGETALGFVKYDPEAAAYAIKENVFSTANLQSMLAAGKTTIPPFPNAGMTLKPVFQALATGKTVGKPDASTPLQVDGHYFRLANWPGPIDPPKAYPPQDWKHCVWIDVDDPAQGPGTGADDKACGADGKSRKPETTYGVGRLMSYKLSKAEADSVNAANLAAFTPGPENPQPIPGYVMAQEGDTSVLLAMHVTSREIEEWTWQTFFWAPNPDDPPFPSSKAVAADRPKELTGPARNYAHCTAYQMLDPNEKPRGGTGKGESVYCFNPWLEAGFGPDVLSDSKPGVYKGKPVKNDVGDQTNCMSCHAQANFAPSTVTTGPGYTGDRYVDLAGPEFKGTLQVDFAWSIPNNAK